MRNWNNLNWLRWCTWQNTKHGKSIDISIAILQKFWYWYCNTFWNWYWYQYWHWQYFLHRVLIFVLPILFKSIVNNPVHYTRYFVITSANEAMFAPVSVCPLARLLEKVSSDFHHEAFYQIMDYCHGKNPINLILGWSYLKWPTCAYFGL